MKQSFKFFKLLFILICIFFISCLRNVNENKNGKVTAFVLYNDQEFKHWLKDTLVKLSIWENQKVKNIAKKEIKLGKDSLSLMIEICYSIAFINGKEKEYVEKEISNMIDLLNEYDELPKKNFKLSFTYQMFYYPSSIKQLKYEYIYEIKNLEVVENDSNAEFSLIRGRLSGKELIKRNKNGRNDTIEIDFIWKGDSLIKHKIQSGTQKM